MENQQVGDSLEGVVSGDPLPEIEGQAVLPEVKRSERMEKGNPAPSGDVKSIEVRRSERTKLPRVISTRGRTDCPRPKSPLMRMAEMRRRGLKGKALRHSGSKGFNDSDMVLFSGKKKAGGRKLQVMESISEGKEGLMEVAGCGEGMAGVGALEGGGDEMERDSGLAQGVLQVLSSPVCNLGEGSNIGKEPIPAGSSADLALDLIESQPLQDMVFIWEQVVQKDDGKDCLMLEMGTQQKDDLGNDSGVNASVHESDAEFPVLSAENLRLAKEKEKFRGGEGKEVPKVVEQPNRDKKGKADGNFKNNHWAGGRNYKASLAEGVMAERNKLVSFEPDKIMKMGMLSESCWLPSIHFSSAETAFLAEKLGHAIVGKFCLVRCVMQMVRGKSR